MQRFVTAALSKGTLFINEMNQGRERKNRFFVLLWGHPQSSFSGFLAEKRRNFGGFRGVFPMVFVIFMIL
ncbi:hypothetical protein CAEBREN_03927 [Caenorhabditis brenneri]|uniref:Uncharacterized protein n=1 Tax=Caenorhabditis brenneri TaxID=135651 RepID=G0NY86_CAEBE|nr:hypothetical protein CAEBREN_03927 [Caenorhabditis brenneri]